MKYLLLASIRLYWCIPAKHRKHCLFKESCSRYVYRIAQEQGFYKGIQALWKRIQQCRNGYTFFDTEQHQKMVLLKDKTIISRTETVV